LPIVVVNAGNLDRNGIADLITAINKFKPKVVGVNFEFIDRKPGDEKLERALRSMENLVMNCNEENGKLVTSYFDGLDYGQCNFRRNHKSEVDWFPPALLVEGNKVEHFAMKILKYCDPEKYKILHDDLSSASTEGKVTFMQIHFLPNNIASFQSFDHTEISSANEKVFAGKIVLIGYLGEKIDHTKCVTDQEDVFLVPATHNHHHEKRPMYATVILANIIQTLTRGELKRFHHE
jgi:CHASE2 domain-containing sensor protein